MMTEIKDRLKSQMEQFNSSIDQVVNASKGLYIKAVEEGNKQFKELVDTGAAQSESGENILNQLRSDVTGPFEDIRSSLDQLKNASLGLVVKARTSGEDYFNELVALGQKQVQKEKNEEAVNAVKDAAKEAGEAVKKAVSA